MKTNHVYLLRDAFSRKTYVGWTTDVKRRLRQHRGLIKGGAKYTRMFRRVELVAFGFGFESPSQAMKVEWRVKRRRGLNARLACLEELSPKFSRVLDKTK